MRRLELLRRLARPSSSKILLWVFDGLGGLPHPETNRSELETAHIPHLDDFARRSSCGVHEPLGPGITTGSGFGHMALFGYPVHEDSNLPRGVLEVLGSTHYYELGQHHTLLYNPLTPHTLAMRGNFASLTRTDSGERVVADRRANAISSKQTARLCELLSSRVSLPGVSVRWYPGRAHRFAISLHAEQGRLQECVSDSDPQRSGLAPLSIAPYDEGASAPTARLLNELIAQSEAALATREEADTILLRGAGFPQQVPTLSELYGLRPAAIATYPVYRGVARQVGMEILPVHGLEPEDQLQTLREHHHAHDFFFFHIKATDSLAHKKDFDGKVAYFERCDALFHEACSLGFDVITVTGDHCTPSIMGAHSWHPVPTAMWSPHVFAGETQVFTERACTQGSLGFRQARDLMPLMLAEAGRLEAYGP